MDSKQISSLMNNVGSAVSFFNMPIGGALIAGSKVLDSFNGLDDEVLEAEYVGLSAIAFELNGMYESKQIDWEKIKLISDSLSSLSVSIQKISKVIS